MPRKPAQLSAGAALLRDADEAHRDVLAGHGRPRSGGWPKVREAHLRGHPACAACGGTLRLNVHHVRPFHLFPALELDPGNLLTLCEQGPGGLNCHLLLGHGGRFSDYVERPADAAAFVAALLSGRRRG